MCCALRPASPPRAVAFRLLQVPARPPTGSACGGLPLAATPGCPFRRDGFRVPPGSALAAARLWHAVSGQDPHGSQSCTCSCCQGQGPHACPAAARTWRTDIVGRAALPGPSPHSRHSGCAAATQPHLQPGRSHACSPRAATPAALRCQPAQVLGHPRAASAGGAHAASARPSASSSARGRRWRALWRKCGPTA